MHNARDDPDGGVSAEIVRFPYEADRFNFACAFSIFTHMQLPEIQNYLGELARARAGGRGVVTFLLMTERDQNPKRLPDEPFHPIGDGVFTTHPKKPERAIALQTRPRS